MNKFKITFSILCLMLCSTFFIVAEESSANEKQKVVVKKKKKSSENNLPDGKKFLITAGGGSSIDIPAKDIVHEGYIDYNKGDSRYNTFVAFGFNILGNVTFSYFLGNLWGIGGSINLGYNFMGGPHVTYNVIYKAEEYKNTYRGLGKLYHSFIADFDFAARSPSKKSMNIIMEAGLRLMPTWSMTVYNEEGVTKIGEPCFSMKSYENPYTRLQEYFAYPGKEVAMMAGPNIFIGLDYLFNDYFDLIGGLRLSAVFGSSNTYYINNHIMHKSYINSIITIAMEFKFNWYKRF